jgi:predicted TIM-barrel fold metal-dependent hydrolase
LGKVFVPSILNITLVHKRLKVGAIPDAVRRVDVDHLNLPGHAFFFEKRIHHQQRVAGGLLERFPRLKFAFMEAGCGWVPYWMERLDEHFEFLQPTVPWLTKPPSEYMKSGQMFYAFEMEEKMLPYVAEFIGAERLVFATDYNHSDSKFPHTVEEVMERKDISDVLKTKIMGDNAAKLYNL